MMVAGIATVILGFLSMMAPMVTGVAVAIMVGAMMLVGGIFQLFASFKAESWGRGILKFLLGALTALAGLMLQGRPVFALLSLTILLAAYFFVAGIFEIVFAFQLKPEKGWGWMLTSGAMSLLLGIMIWRQWPVSGAWAIGILVGIKLLFAGMTMISVGSAARQVATGIDEATA